MSDPIENQNAAMTNTPRARAKGPPLMKKYASKGLDMIIQRASHP
jgi:hypothetical protein